MATYTLSPSFIQAPLDNSGLIVPSGLLWTYLAGTSTPATTHTTSSGVAHTNPIVLDSAGRVPQGLYLTPGLSYKFVYETAATPPAHGTVLKTQDNIAAVPLSTSNQDVNGIAGVSVSAGECVYLSDGSGALQAGQWYPADSDIAYASVTPMIGMVVNAIAAGATGVIRLAGQLTVTGPLTPGSSYYVSSSGGVITTTVGARFVGVAESTTSIILTPNPPMPDVIGTAGVTIAAGDCVYLSDGSGALTAGRWYLADADLTYGSLTPIIGIALSGMSTGATGAIRLSGPVTLAGPLTAGARYYVSSTAGAITTTVGARFVGQASSTTMLIVGLNPPPVILSRTMQGMLTLTTGVPFPATDVTGATSAYFTPDGSGNVISLYNGVAWLNVTFAELTISLVGLTASRPYDVFGYLSAGALAIETLAWTNATTRATAIAFQDGTWVKSGDATRRLLGSIYINASGGQSDDSYAKRYVDTARRDVTRTGRVTEPANSWMYTTATIRQMNGNAANQLDFMVCLPGRAIVAKVSSANLNATGGTQTSCSIGEDSTSAPATGCLIGQQSATGVRDFFAAFLETIPTPGRHIYTALEWSVAAGTTTWYGDDGAPTVAQAGISGEIHG